MPRRHSISKPSELDQAGGAGERGDHVDRAEFAMRQAEFGAPALGENRDEVGLAEARSKRQQKARGQQPGVRDQELYDWHGWLLRQNCGGDNVK